MASAANQAAAGLSLSKFAQATDLKKRLWFTLGALSAKLSFKVAGASAAAKAAIEKAGGSVEVIEVVPAAEKAAAKKNSVRDAKKAARA